MSIVAIVVAIILFVSTAVVIRIDQQNGTTIPQLIEKIAQTTTPTLPMSPTAIPTSTVVPSEPPTNTPSRSAPTSKIAPSPTTMPSPTATQQANILIYPGARLISQSDNDYTYESTDSAEIVGNWYRQQMESQGYNVRNYIKTTVNGQTQISIAAASSSSSLNVSISQSPSSVTRIEIER